MTWFACFHPRSVRWVAAGGWVEVCGECSETRRAGAASYWPATYRTLRVAAGEMLTFGADGRTLYRREPLEEWRARAAGLNIACEGRTEWPG